MVAWRNIFVLKNTQEWSVAENRNGQVIPIIAFLEADDVG